MNESVSFAFHLNFPALGHRKMDLFVIAKENLLPSGQVPSDPCRLCYETNDDAICPRNFCAKVFHQEL